MVRVMRMRMNGLYTIGEAARLTGLSVKAVRHYADERVVVPSARSEAGYRLYSPEDIWRLSLVRLLREMEFGLPMIQRILARSPDIQSVIEWQKSALDLQIAHLKDVRIRLDQIPENIWGQASLAHLYTVLEGMTMSTEEKEAWLKDRWSEAMIAESAPEDWRASFLQQVKEWLPKDWGPDQTAAWADLQALLDDPEVREQLRQMVQPFWRMVDSGNVHSSSWNRSMRGLLDRALELHREGRGPESSEVQALVDEWLNVFAAAVGKPVDELFIQRFRQYAESVENETNQKLWDVLSRLKPEERVFMEAQRLMLAGLRRRMDEGN